MLENMHKEIYVIARSCGVLEPRSLKRMHAELINEKGVSVPMTIMYPDAMPLDQTSLNQKH